MNKRHDILRCSFFLVLLFTLSEFFFLFCFFRKLLIEQIEEFEYPKQHLRVFMHFQLLFEFLFFLLWKFYCCSFDLRNLWLACVNNHHFLLFLFKGRWLARWLILNEAWKFARGNIHFELFERMLHFTESFIQFIY